jgi:hypothetical protein
MSIVVEKYLSGFTYLTCSYLISHRIDSLRYRSAAVDPSTSSYAVFKQLKHQADSRHSGTKPTSCLRPEFDTREKRLNRISRLNAFPVTPWKQKIGEQLIICFI